MSEHGDGGRQGGVPPSLGHGPRYPGSLVVDYVKHRVQERLAQRKSRPRSATLTRMEQFVVAWEGVALAGVVLFFFLKFSADTYVHERAAELDRRRQLLEQYELQCRNSMSHIRRIQGSLAFWHEVEARSQDRVTKWTLQHQVDQLRQELWRLSQPAATPASEQQQPGPSARSWWARAWSWRQQSAPAHTPSHSAPADESSTQASSSTQFAADEAGTTSSAGSSWWGRVGSWFRRRQPGSDYSSVADDREQSGVRHPSRQAGDSIETEADSSAACGQSGVVESDAQGVGSEQCVAVESVESQFRGWVRQVRDVLQERTQAAVGSATVQEGSEGAGVTTGTPGSSSDSSNRNVSGVVGAHQECSHESGSQPVRSQAVTARVPGSFTQQQDDLLGQQQQDDTGGGQHTHSAKEQHAEHAGGALAVEVSTSQHAQQQPGNGTGTYWGGRDVQRQEAVALAVAAAGDAMLHSADTAEHWTSLQARCQEKRRELEGLHDNELRHLFEAETQFNRWRLYSGRDLVFETGAMVMLPRAATSWLFRPPPPHPKQPQASAPQTEQGSSSSCSATQQPQVQADSGGGATQHHVTQHMSGTASTLSGSSTHIQQDAVSGSAELHSSGSGTVDSGSCCQGSWSVSSRSSGECGGVMVRLRVWWPLWEAGDAEEQLVAAQSTWDAVWRAVMGDEEGTDG